MPRIVALIAVGVYISHVHALHMPVFMQLKHFDIWDRLLCSSLNFFLNFHIWKIEFTNKSCKKFIVSIFLLWRSKSLTHIEEEIPIIYDISTSLYKSQATLEIGHHGKCNLNIIDENSFWNLKTCLCLPCVRIVVFVVKKFI
jgi:hypothetical protein